MGNTSSYIYEINQGADTGTVDSRYSGSQKYGHLDIPAIWFGTEC